MIIELFRWRVRTIRAVYETSRLNFKLLSDSLNTSEQFANLNSDKITKLCIIKQGNKKFEHQKLNLKFTRFCEHTYIK